MNRNPEGGWILRIFAQKSLDKSNNKEEKFEARIT